MRVTPVLSVPAFKYEMRRRPPVSFYDLVEAVSKKTAMRSAPF